MGKEHTRKIIPDCSTPSPQRMLTLAHEVSLEDKINIITDIRYAEYPEDEYFWLTKKANGVLIHVSRYDEIDGERHFIKPANPSEEKNDHRVKKLADFSLNWKTEKNSFQLEKHSDLLP